MGAAVYQPFGVSVAQVASESPRREPHVHLVYGGKDHIRERESGSAPTQLCGLLDGATEVGQERHEPMLFFGLCGIVSCPCTTLYHPLSIRDRSRITTVIWLIYAEFSDKDVDDSRVYVDPQLAIRDRSRYNRFVTENQDPPNEELRELARRLGRRGGLKGGPARAAKMTPEERSESARKAVNARWAKKRREESS